MHRAVLIRHCTPTFVQYTWMTRAFARTISKALVERGAMNWYFVTVNYMLGYQLEADTVAVVRAAGGTVVGSVKVPLGTSDYSSHLLRAHLLRAQHHVGKAEHDSRDPGGAVQPACTLRRLPDHELGFADRPYTDRPFP